ncbi:MAG: hypothetical protein M0002_08445 [Rhodospirillales bacterium]|nr:hypothetical protein [Rhodospirillales bacterium]
MLRLRRDAHATTLYLLGANMFVSNPFALLSRVLPPAVMQAYVVVMLLAVAIGTLGDLYHKQSATYFALRRIKSKAAAQRQLGAWETVLLAIKTIGIEVATAGEFSKWPRRLSHIMVFYGFLVYVITTIAMVFIYPTSAHTPDVLAVLWNVGVLLVLAGGCWFFFVLKVNVAHEGHSPLHLMRADLFIGSLLASMAFALVWEFAQVIAGSSPGTMILLGLYVFFTTLLFFSVPWSKFAHMFYKPVAAFQKRVEEANGSSDLPRPAQGSNIKG